MLRRGAAIDRGPGRPTCHSRWVFPHHVHSGLGLPVPWKSVVLEHPGVIPGNSGELATVGGGGAVAGDRWLGLVGVGGWIPKRRLGSNICAPNLNR